MNYLISEHSINKKLKEIFGQPLKYRNHIIFLDFVSKYSKDRLGEGKMTHLVWSHGVSKKDEIISNVIYINRDDFIQGLFNLYELKYPAEPYIEFKHSEFIKYTSSKIKDKQLEKTISDLNKRKISVKNFPIAIFSKESVGCKKGKIILENREIDNEPIITKFECGPVGKYDYRYKVYLDSKFMLYTLNNIMMGHSTMISTKLYDWIYLPTVSHMFMKRFMSPYYFAKKGYMTKKTIKFETINSELGTLKSDRQILNQVLRPIEKANYTQMLFNKGIVVIQYYKSGNVLRRVDCKDIIH